MKYTTVLWDLDGTILDSGPGVFDSFRKTFAAIGIEQPTEDQLRSYLGPPLKVTFDEHLGLDAETTQRGLEIYRDFYLDGGAINASLYPGVLELIAACRDAGITNSLATSKATTGVQLVGEHYDFLGLFDFLGTADTTVNRLNKTDVLTYALDGLTTMGADLSRVILVGDRIHDVEGARNHGIEVALVKWGYGTTEEWEQADYVVEDVAALKHLLLDSQ